MKVRSSGSSTSVGAEITVPGEDHARAIRNINGIVYDFGSLGNAVSRAMLSPVLAIQGKRSQLRYLQVAEKVASEALFTKTSNDDAYDGENTGEAQSSSSSQATSLFSSISSTEEGNGNGNEEAILSMQTVLTTILMVKHNIYPYLFLEIEQSVVNIL